MKHATTERNEVSRPEPGRWSLAARIAFRFVFSYYALIYIVPRLFSRSELLSEKYGELWNAVMLLVDEAFLHMPYELFDSQTDASGWVRLFCNLAFAGVAAAVWSVLDRNRLQYARLHPWLRLLLRYVLASAMIRYGTVKIIPSQMIAPPPLGALQQQLGDLFPNYLLWWTVGASPAFETATGLAELLGGVLLLLPQTAMLGALVSAGNMLFVFLLNMCYDVSVKQGSLHLLLMAVVLVAPDLPRLADVFLFHRRTERSRLQPLFRNRWLNAVPHVLLLVYGLTAIKSGLEWSAQRYKTMNPPRSPLYGVWSVESFERDGREVPLYTEPDRWRLVQFRTPGSLQVEQMAGTRKQYPLGLDMEKKTMTLGPPPEGSLAFRRPEKDVLLLDGVLEGRRVRAKLRKMPLIRRTT